MDGSIIGNGCGVSSARYPPSQLFQQGVKGWPLWKRSPTSHLQYIVNEKAFLPATEAFTNLMAEESFNRWSMSLAGRMPIDSTSNMERPLAGPSGEALLVRTLAVALHEQ